MKKLLHASVLVFTFCISALTQTNETSSCPTISVTGPSGIVMPNESAQYSAFVDTKGKNLKIEYVWSVSYGEILEGQGTQKITVRQPEIENLTVTVEIKGLPEGCPNTFSESYAIAIDYVTIQIDEFSISEVRIDKTRLDNLIAELQKDSTSRAYIFEKFKRNISERAVKQKIQKITDYLMKEKKLDIERFVILTTLTDKNLTQFWIVPAGASPPKIKDN